MALVDGVVREVLEKVDVEGRIGRELIQGSMDFAKFIAKKGGVKGLRLRRITGRRRRDVGFLELEKSKRSVG